MKMNVKKSLLSLLLCLCLCFLPACAAGGDGTGGAVEVPQGMQDATGNGTGYYLFLPTDWQIDHTTGVTIATYATAKITFAAFPSEKEPDAYWQASRGETEAMFTDFSLDEEGGTTLLGKAAALRYKFSGIYYDYDGDGEKDKYGVTQYVAKKDGQLFVLTYLAPFEEDYEQYSKVVEVVLTNFRFAEKDAPATQRPTGNTENAPAGMQEITDSAIHDFRLFVPTDWQIDLQNGTVSAYVSETDRTSISLVRNYPTMASTLPEYFENLSKSYADKLQNYELLEKEIRGTATVLELDSLRYEFRATYNGVTYHFFEELFVKGSHVYTFTYTATEELYETHLTEAEEILSAIAFS